jgi:uncharacterized protein
VRGRKEAARLAALEPDTIVLIINRRIERDHIPSLCARVRAVVEGSDADQVVCDVSAVIDPDAVTVDGLARLQLTIRRLGRRIRVRYMCDELHGLLDLMGLADIVPPGTDLSLDVRRQTATDEFPFPLRSDKDGQDASVSEGGADMGRQVVHFEVVTNGDARELAKFYADTFDWSIDTNNPLNYGLVSDKDAGIGGGIGGTPDPKMPGHVTFYVQVPDLDATLKEIESRGGKTLMPPESVVPGTTIAIFQDPHGNMIGLTQGE